VGFLPGGMVSKMQPWTRPIYDAFLEKDLINKKNLDKYIVDGKIEMIPLAFMRGRTFSDSFIFADEMQNSTPEQMLMLMTRVGNGSKLVVSGDLAQSDITNSSDGNNGLADFLNKYRKWMEENEASDDSSIKEMIRVVEFEKSDIRRSKITSVVLDLYSFGKE
jgi:phosphate starvation-inducible PhoH-like protein